MADVELATEAMSVRSLLYTTINNMLLLLSFHLFTLIEIVFS